MLKPEFGFDIASAGMASPLKRSGLDASLVRRILLGRIELT
jgi:hypothetical protein